MGSGLDFQTSTQVFRKDRRLILAMNRHHATILGVRVAYVSGGYSAGQVMSRNSVSGLHEKYNSAGSSGTDTAVGVLFNDITDMVASQSDVGQLIVKGELYYANCTSIDSDAVNDLKGRTVIDGSGVTILMF
jgi:hypothetical protein